MTNLKDELLSTLLHTLEIAVALVVAYAAMKLFDIRSELVQDVVFFVLVAAAKFSRVSDASIEPDFVNPSFKPPVKPSM
jgi:predicted Kef-type K+ transport protein